MIHFPHDDKGFAISKIYVVSSLTVLKLSLVTHGLNGTCNIGCTRSPVVYVVVGYRSGYRGLGDYTRLQVAGG